MSQENGFIVTTCARSFTVPYRLGNVCLVGPPDSGKTLGFLHPWMTRWMDFGNVILFAAYPETHLLDLSGVQTATLNFDCPERSDRLLFHHRRGMDDFLALVGDPVIDHMLNHPHDGPRPARHISDLREPGALLSVIVGQTRYSERAAGFCHFLLQEQPVAETPTLFVFDDAQNLNFRHFIPRSLHLSATNLRTVCVVRDPAVFPDGRIPAAFGAAVVLSASAPPVASSETKIFPVSQSPVAVRFTPREAAAAIQALPAA